MIIYCFIVAGHLPTLHNEDIEPEGQCELGSSVLTNTEACIINVVDENSKIIEEKNMDNVPSNVEIDVAYMNASTECYDLNQKENELKFVPDLPRRTTIQNKTNIGQEDKCPLGHSISSSSCSPTNVEKDIASMSEDATNVHIETDATLEQTKESPLPDDSKIIHTIPT